MSNVSKDIDNDLIQAARSDDTNGVKRLIKEGANVDTKDNRGYTPLHLAAKNNNKDVVEVLLKKDGIDVNAVDKDGKTPFDLTTNEEIKALLKAAENPGDGSVDEPSTDSEGVQEEDAGTQTEEQPSSFFGSLFSILMKPFSLIASFFGSFFSWLFGSNEEKIDESTSQTDASVSLLRSDSLDEKKIDAQPGNHSFLAPHQSAEQTDASQLGADYTQLLG